MRELCGSLRRFKSTKKTKDEARRSWTGVAANSADVAQLDPTPARPHPRPTHATHRVGLAPSPRPASVPGPDGHFWRSSAVFVAVRAWTGGAALGAMHSGRVTSPPVEAPKTSSGFQLLRRPASTQPGCLRANADFQGLVYFNRSSDGPHTQNSPELWMRCVKPGLKPEFGSSPTAALWPAVHLVFIPPTKST